MIAAATFSRSRANGPAPRSYRNIEFVQGDAESFDDPAPFDLAIGRYVLIHQADPAAFIRSAASHVRHGGVVAFHEVAIYGECPIVPPLQFMAQAWDWIIGAFSSVMTHPDAAGRMMMHFEDAGLKAAGCVLRRFQWKAGRRPFLCLGGAH